MCITIHQLWSLPHVQVQRISWCVLLLYQLALLNCFSLSKISLKFIGLKFGLQEAVALSFERELQRIGSPECYYNSVSEELRPKRDKMAKFLAEVGMTPTVPEGGYFMIADFSKLSKYGIIFISDVENILILFNGEVMSFVQLTYQRFSE